MTYRSDFLQSSQTPARKLRAILEREGVRVVHRNASTWEMRRGDTMAVGALMRLYRDRGEAFLVDVLRSIREPGELRADTLRALEDVLLAFPEWRDEVLPIDVDAISITKLRRQAPRKKRERVVYLAGRLIAGISARRAARRQAA
jgi:hypothetical protein